MPNDSETDTGRTARARGTLSRIADALGEPRSAFYDNASASAELAGLIELVRLWDELKCDGDRDKILALARSLAAASAVQDLAAE